VSSSEAVQEGAEPARNRYRRSKKDKAKAKAMFKKYNSYNLDEICEQLKDYTSRHGTGWVPSNLWEDPALGSFAQAARYMHSYGDLPPEDRARLEAAGMQWSIPEEHKLWHGNYLEFLRYLGMGGNPDLPHALSMMQDKGKTFKRGLIEWYWKQIFLYQQRRLEPWKVERLRKHGVRLERKLSGAEGAWSPQEPLSLAQYEDVYSPDNPDWDDMLERLKEWRKRFLSVIIPITVFDDPELGEWLAKASRDLRRGRLSEEQAAALKDLGVPAKKAVNKLDAKWWANYHSARRYKEAYGSIEGLCDVDNFGKDDDPAFVEASRFIERQQKLYKKQKLSDRKVKVLKELGVKLRRDSGPKKSNLHPVLREKVDVEAIRRAG